MNRYGNWSSHLMYTCIPTCRCMEFTTLMGIMKIILLVRVVS